jgi:trehalose-phosphatase
MALSESGSRVRRIPGSRVPEAAKHDVEVMTGKANLEVRPRFVNKGEIAKRLVLDYGDQPGDAPEFVFCLGDDFTDEGMYLMSTSAEQLSNNCRHVPLFATVEAPGRSRLFRNRWC